MTTSVSEPAPLAAAAPRHAVSSPLRISMTASQIPQEVDVGYFSPLDGAGVYAFDRILKSGQVQKRRKRTKAWSSIKLVLRPNTLSIYKDKEATQLRHQIKLSDVTAVTPRKDKHGRGWRLGLFDLFTHARNFHLEAESEQEAKEWCEMIRREAGLKEEDERAVRTVAGTQSRTRTMSNPPSIAITPGPALRVQRATSSSPEGRTHFRSVSIGQKMQLPDTSGRTSESYDPSATDVGSFSDFSDEPMFGVVGDLPVHTHYRAHSVISSSTSIPGGDNLQETQSARPSIENGKPFYMLEAMSEDERVICHGFLRCLKTRGGVRQWKKYWVVLRRKSLAFYKNEEEYRVLLLLPLTSLVDAVETDALSHRRQYCMQVITDEQTFRLAAADEDDLSKWLGSLKSVLARKQHTV